MNQPPVQPVTRRDDAGSPDTIAGSEGEAFAIDYVRRLLSSTIA